MCHALANALLLSCQSSQSFIGCTVFESRMLPHPSLEHPASTELAPYSPFWQIEGSLVQTTEVVGIFIVLLWL
jgi:hypothetical protein